MPTPDAAPNDHVAARIPALDALRGLAVLAVVAFHLGFSRARGGWVGVDVFFVLSGYLITSLLLEERLRSGAVRLGAFWARRARRLLPALLVVIAGVAVVAWFLGGADTYPTLRDDGLAALFYVANWRFIASDQSYFSSFSVSPLRHMWSLAIEEQFYVVWPLAFVALTRLVRRRRVQVGLLVAVALAATWWTRILVLHGADPSRAYYGSDTRLPTILAGCVAALATRHLPLVGAQVRAGLTAAAAIGAAFLVFVVVDVPESSRWLYADGGFTLIAVAAAAVVVAAARLTSGPLAGLGRIPPLVRAGLLSYSLYLWHWPVIVFLDADRVHTSTFGRRLLQVAVAWALAELSYRFVEQPIRTRRVRVPKPVPVTLASFGAVALLVFGLLVPVAGQTPPTSGGGEHVSARAGQAGVPQVLMLGDSQAFVDSANVPDGYPYGVRAVFQAACDLIGDHLAVGDHVDDVVPDCLRWPERWAAAARRHPDAVVVALGLRELFDPIIGGHRLRVGSSAWRTAFHDAVSRALGTIRVGTDAPIFWLDVPCYTWANGHTAGEEHDAGRLAAVNAALREALASDSRVHVVPYAARVCDGAGGTHPRGGLRPDGTHLSRAAARDLWTYLRPMIAAALRRPGG